MIVVSNTSPILNLSVIGQLNLIERFYKKVFIPQEVAAELSIILPEQIGTIELQKLPWIETRSITNRELVNSLVIELDAGEAEAIVLALDMKADLVLLDERRGRKVASRFGLKFIGLLGILVEAKRKGYIISLKPVLNDLIVKAGFWISDQLYTRVLHEVGEKQQ